MSGMKISIVVPFFNSEATLKKCIDSLLAQKNVELEIVLVNDFSTDASYVLCEEYAQKEERVVLLDNTSRGVSSARNCGLEFCTGEIVGFCDADDYYADDVLEKVCNFFEEDSYCDLLITGFNVHSQNGKIESRRLKVNSFLGDGKREFSLILNDPNVMGFVWNKFFKRELMSDVRFNENLSLCEDTYFCLQYVSKNKGLTVKISPLITYFYCQNDVSVTHNEDCLFDKEDKLKYYEFLDLVTTEYKLGCFEAGQVRCARARLAYDALMRFEINNRKRSILINEIKKNYFYFVRYGYKVGIKAYIRMIIIMFGLKRKAR